MIEIITLFLGLITGVRTVELNVNGPVAAVTIQLDGETIQVLESAPWVFQCDLGDEPLPHDLVAIALDEDGEEIDRAEQWINMGANRSRASVAIQADAQGHARSLRLNWESVGQPDPGEIEVIFDGKPLQVTDPDHIPLPNHDGDAFHYVSASLEFDDYGKSQRETDFGGGRTEEISTELTAVVVDLRKRVRLPSVPKMRAWFLERGFPVPIHGSEKGGMELFVVCGPGVQEVFDQLAGAVLRANYEVNSGLRSVLEGWNTAQFFTGSPEALQRRIRVLGEFLEPLREYGALSEKVQISFVSSSPGALNPTGLSREMFARSRPYSSSEGGLNWLFQEQQPIDFEPRVSAAVALAGMTAHDTNSRRAVLLITSDQTESGNEYSPAQTRNYLNALGVPLYVWSFTADASDHPWGEAQALGDPAKPLEIARRLRLASENLQRDLKNQRVVWLEGRHLPNRITLGPNARGIRLAGGLEPAPR